jgi:hypothetical protein
MATYSPFMCLLKVYSTLSLLLYLLLQTILETNWVHFTILAFTILQDCQHGKTTGSLTADHTWLPTKGITFNYF